MKTQFIKMAAVLATVFSISANAAPILIDLDDAGASATVPLDNLGVEYFSHTKVNTVTGAVTTVGGIDAVGETFGGMIGGSGIFANDAAVVGCPSCGTENTLNSDPNVLLFPIFSSEYATSNTGLTFGLTLNGSVNLGTGQLTYTSGGLGIYGYDLGTGASTLLMETTFVSSSINAGNQFVNTKVSNITAAGNDTFFMANGTSFEDYLLTAPITMVIEQFVDAAGLLADIAAPIASNPATNEVYVSVEHSAVARFEVPEPASIAIMGLGLLGIAASARRRKS